MRQTAKAHPRPHRRHVHKHKGRRLVCRVSEGECVDMCASLWVSKDFDFVDFVFFLQIIEF